MNYVKIELFLIKNQKSKINYEFELSKKHTNLFNISYIVIKINRFQYFYTKKFSLSFKEKKNRNRKNFKQKKSKIFDQIKKLFKKK